METFATLGEMLLKRYTTDFTKQMQMLIKVEIPVLIRCLHCHGVRGDSSPCFACGGRGIEAIPSCELDKTEIEEYDSMPRIHLPKQYSQKFKVASQGTFFKT